MQVPIEDVARTLKAYLQLAARYFFLRMSDPSFTNYYKVLGVPVTAAPEYTAQAHSKAISHEDLWWNAMNMRERSSSIIRQSKLNDAYWILSHPANKTIFDRRYLSELVEAELANITNIEPVEKQDWPRFRLLLWQASLHRGDRDSESYFGRILGVSGEEVMERSDGLPSVVSGPVVASIVESADP